MQRFKFFRNAPISLLENEQSLHYWTDNYMNLTGRVIAWSRDIHINSWRRVTYHGTMEGFFNHRLEIPVIGSIYVPGHMDGSGVYGRHYNESDRDYLTYTNIGTYPIEITYYEYITH
jgi:hypothetical protein